MMAAATFGKKGLTENAELARRKADFIEAERARAAELGESSPDPEWPDRPSDTTAARNLPHTKSLFRAYMSWLVGGSLGSHRFYLGAYQTAIAQGSLCVFGWLMVVLGQSDAGAGVLASLGPYAAGAGTLWVAYDGIQMRSLRDKLEERMRIASRRG